MKYAAFIIITIVYIVLVFILSVEFTRDVPNECLGTISTLDDCRAHYQSH